MSRGLYQIVNDKDELVGYKLRRDINYKTDIYRIAALWLTNPEGQVLIAQRVLTKDKDPGKWGPAAAGTVEKGETYETNIYKEAEEEIGLSGVKFQLGPKQRFNEPRQSFCQWYLGESDKKADEFTLQAEEVEQVAWISPDDLYQDVQNNPDKYVPSMKLIINLLKNKHNTSKL